MYFSISGWGCAFAAAVLLLFLVARKKLKWDEPSLIFPALIFFKSVKGAGKAKFIRLPYMLYHLSLTVFLLGLTDPHIGRLEDRQTGNRKPLPREGEAVYLVLDHSGSMESPIQSTDIKNIYRFPSKLDALKKFVKQFIQGRENDLIGLVAFARTAQVLSPLTLEHAALEKQLEKLSVVQEKSENGSAIGYAIFKTASLIAATRDYEKTYDQIGTMPSYKINGAAMIVVSDGVQEINPLDRDKRLRTIDIPEAAKFAKEQKIRLYIISLMREDLETQHRAYRNMLKQSARLTGGKYYDAPNAANMQHIFHQIDLLEKSRISLPPSVPEQKAISQRIYSLYPFLIAAGLAFLFSAIFIETVLLKRLP